MRKMKEKPFHRGPGSRATRPALPGLSQSHPGEKLSFLPVLNEKETTPQLLQLATESPSVHPATGSPAPAAAGSALPLHRGSLPKRHLDPIGPSQHPTHNVDPVLTMEYCPATPGSQCSLHTNDRGLLSLRCLIPTSLPPQARPISTYNIWHTITNTVAVALGCARLS